MSAAPKTLIPNSWFLLPFLLTLSTGAHSLPTGYSMPYRDGSSLVKGGRKQRENMVEVYLSYAVRWKGKMFNGKH
jgi:hypothetical protein